MIAMTAHTMPTEIQKCRDAGMDDYLPKPLSEETIILLFNKYIPKMNPSSVTEHSALVYIDLQNMKKMFGNDNRIIADLLQLFSTEYSEELKQLAKACESRELEKVYTIAHNLKTTVSSLKANSSLLVPLIAIEKYRNTEPEWEVIKAQIDVLTALRETVLLEIDTVQKSIQH